jgi:hypothetical protein
MNDCPDNCGKTFRATKYGLPWMLTCGLPSGHSGLCRDLENEAYFMTEDR